MKKNKLLMSMSAGLLTSTSLASATTSLSSCSSNSSNALIDEYTQFDKENGFDQKWFDSFVQSYKNQIVSQAIEPSSLSDEAKDEQIASLDKSILEFKTNLSTLLNDPTSKNFAYTSITNAMIEYGQLLYSYEGKPIRITRSCNTTLNDVQTMFNNMAQSCETYMVNNGLDRQYIEQTMAQSKELCAKKLSSLCQAYADPAMIMAKARQALPELFAGANEEIGLLGAQQALSDFAENFHIEYDLEKGARFDELMTADGGATTTDEDGKTVRFAVGNDISAFINNMFIITNVKTGKRVQFKRNELIPGFRLTAVLKSVKTDPLANDYSFGIDWQCISDCYISLNETRKNRVTAHFGNNVNDNDALRANILNAKPNQTTLNDFFANKDIIEPTPISYAVPLTIKKETEVLEDYYLKDIELKDYDDFIGEISFEFDDPSKCCVDPFVSADKYKDPASNDGDNVVTLGFNDLARAGLKINLKSNRTNLDTSIRLDKLIAVNEWDNENERLKLSETETPQEFKIRQFIQNCMITSKCVLTEGTEGTNVKCEIYIAYQNYNSIASKDQINKHAVKVCDVRVDNLKPSKYLYWQMTEKYNQIYAYVQETIDISKYQDAVDKENISLIKQCVFLFVDLAIAWASYALMVFGPLKISSKIALGLWGSFCVFDSIVSITRLLYEIIAKYNPLLNFFQRAKKLKNSNVTTTTINHLNEDAANAHIAQASKFDKFWKINKEKFDTEFNEHYISGEQINFADLRKYNQKFGNILSYENMNEFLKMQGKLELLENDFAAFNKKWEKGGQHYQTVDVLDKILIWSMRAQLVLMVAELLVGIFYAIKAIYTKIASRAIRASDDATKNLLNGNSNSETEGLDQWDILENDERKVMSGERPSNETFTSENSEEIFVTNDDVQKVVDQVDIDEFCENKNYHSNPDVNESIIEANQLPPYLGDESTRVSSVQETIDYVSRLKSDTFKLSKKGKKLFAEKYSKSLVDNISSLPEQNVHFIDEKSVLKDLIEDFKAIRANLNKMSAKEVNTFVTNRFSKISPEAIKELSKNKQLVDIWVSCIKQSIAETLIRAMNANTGKRVIILLDYM